MMWINESTRWAWMDSYDQLATHDIHSEVMEECFGVNIVQNDFVYYWYSNCNTQGILICKLVNR